MDKAELEQEMLKCHFTISVIAAGFYYSFMHKEYNLFKIAEAAEEGLGICRLNDCSKNDAINEILDIYNEVIKVGHEKQREIGERHVRGE